MIVFPNAKINLGLYVIQRRFDGFHDLETLFFPIPLCDALELLPSNGHQVVQFTSSGLPIDGPVEKNICVQAYTLLQHDYPDLPPVKMHLHKNIPMGAGLGGGSSDGAFALAMMNKKFSLDITKEKLAAYALELGSDCPFFIHNRPSLAMGRGEQLEEIALDLSAYSLALVYPGIHVSTAEAFSMMMPTRNRKPIEEIINLPVEEWKHLLVNDFEKPVYEKHPSIKQVKEELYEKGAVYAALTGSGSAVYGLFPKTAKPVFSFPPSYRSYLFELSPGTR